MNLPFTRGGEPDLVRLRGGLIILAALTTLTGVGGGYLGYLASQDASTKESALAARQAARQQRDSDLQAASAKAGVEAAAGIQAIRAFQESVDQLAISHQVKVTTFQTATALGPMKSSYGTPEAPGWGMALVDISLSGSSRSVFAFFRDLATISSPFEIEKAYFEPNSPSPNGGTQVNAALNLKVFAKQRAGA